MEFADYPKHLRDEWKDIQASWDRAFDRRGRRRQLAVDQVRDWVMGKLFGYEERYKRLNQECEYRYAKETWKSEEYERAERCTESLDVANDKLYDQKMNILELEKEVADLKAQLKDR